MIVLLERKPPRYQVLFIYPINKPMTGKVPTPATVAGVINPQLKEVLDVQTIAALDDGTMAYEILSLRPFEVENKAWLEGYYKTKLAQSNAYFSEQYQDYGKIIEVK